MADTFGQTLSMAGEAQPATPSEQTTPALLLLIEASRPAAGAVLMQLGTVRGVSLGRGSARHIATTDGELQVQLPDRWLSSKHARIEPSFGRWVLTDTESKNGCVVDGQATKRAVLADGAIVELGHSVFIFFERLPVLANWPACYTPPVAATSTFDAAWAEELTRLQAIAASEISILVQGESGVGKEVLARWIHQASGRKGAFVAVNCGALADQLVESELFGHRRGAFSGATADHEGLVRAASGGTLFLDEIGDLPATSQAALLRVLQEREVTPVGGTRAMPVDLRVVAATHRDLDDMVASGAFRQDLLARLSGFRTEIPTLRERRVDLGLLIAALLAPALADGHPGLELEAVRALWRYPWPLNIRELGQTLQTALVLAGGQALGPSHLPEQVRTGRPVGAPKPVIYDEQDRKLRDEVEAALRAHQGNISAVARVLNKDRKQIQRWVKRFALDPDTYR